jgi:hypothetical protein
MGLIGALIVEPEGSKFLADYQPKGKHPDPKDPRADAVYITRASGTVVGANGQPLFREFVAVFDDSNAVVGGTSINYTTAPLRARGNPAPTENTMSKVVSDYQLNPPAEPPTPVYAVAKGSPLRLRLLHPGGSGNDMTIALHGHVWQEEPWQQASTSLGNNSKSNWQGAHDRFGPNTTFNLLLGPGKATGGAGGVNSVTGDYLLRDFLVGSYESGGWGIVRVGDPGKDVVSIIEYLGAPGMDNSNNPFALSGRNTVNLTTGALATHVTAASVGAEFSQSPAGPWTKDKIDLRVGIDGKWEISFVKAPMGAIITVTSPEGGSASIKVSAAAPQLARQPANIPPARDTGRTLPQDMMRQSPLAPAR